MACTWRVWHGHFLGKVGALQNSEPALPWAAEGSKEILSFYLSEFKLLFVAGKCNLEQSIN